MRPWGGSAIAGSGLADAERSHCSSGAGFSLARVEREDSGSGAAGGRSARDGKAIMPRYSRH
jgi:hypothetical protein